MIFLIKASRGVGEYSAGLWRGGAGRHQPSNTNSVRAELGSSVRESKSLCPRKGSGPDQFHPHPCHHPGRPDPARTQRQFPPASGPGTS